VGKYSGISTRLRPPGQGRGSSGGSSFGGYDSANRIRDMLDRLGLTSHTGRTILAGLIAGIIIAFIVIVVIDFYRVKGLANFQPNITTKIFDKNDILISELFRQKREVVPFDRIPRHLVHAFIAIEDNEFYDHYGINIKGIVRAFFINIFSGRIRQGGSTITQQLSKILLTERERSIYRKIKEAFIALMMEMTYSKDQILSFYLNQIFLGHGAYGVESASRFYFQKHVWELDLAECALLASLPSAPNRLSPIRHPQRSMERHRVVLARMVDMGYITIRQAEEAYLKFWPDYLDQINDLPPSYNTWSARLDKAPWFTEHIRRILVKKYGEETVYEKGLLVYTTLDVKKQIAAQKLLKDALRRQSSVSGSMLYRNEEYFIDTFTDTVEMISLLFDIDQFRKSGSRESLKVNNYIQESAVDEIEILNFFWGMNNIGQLIEDYRKSFSDERESQTVEGCLISIDHRTGYIEAMVGGSEFSSINQLNRVTQSKRQPGSAIKPLLYAAAMDAGNFSPATTVMDSPIVYLDSEGGDWIPENYHSQYQGLVRLRTALALSINVVSIRIAEALGIDTVMQYFAKLLSYDKAEMKQRIPRNLSIAIGSFEVTPLELTRAYAIIANGGKNVIPFSIRMIKDREGKVLENIEETIKKKIMEQEEKGTIQIIKPATAQIMISMLKSVISEGTASAAGIGRPVGGKTGTTNNWRDAWFVGFTPQLTTCVWIGYDNLGLTLGSGQAAGGVAAPLWGQYMRLAMQDEAVTDFPVFGAVEEHRVCARSGLNPSGSCTHTYNEIFPGGTIPTETCSVCGNFRQSVHFSKKGPSSNITQRQHSSVMKNVMKKEKSGSSILEHVGDDLLR
jgi:penicillin-binding protein 1A